MMEIRSAAASITMTMSTAITVVSLLLLLVLPAAQSQNNATTHPSDVAAINSIFGEWRISDRSTANGWNISGEPCSGTALVPSNVDNINYNPIISCDCSFNNRTTCRITALKVYSLDVVGVLPDELWTLTYLTNLNLGQNYLTGPLPASIGNLTRMQYLSLGINALSGLLPVGLGLLTELRSLSFSTNSFSGPLPSELGNLSNLEQLYFDSSGVSGVVPSSFANLTRLHTVWGSDNNLTGRIPDFIGSWSRLNVLRFQGNSFDGPIPSTFSNLTALLDLRISDLSSGNSSLEFLTNLRSLTLLILRNNDLSGSIPSNIGEFQNLTQLDLSFNNLRGQIPSQLFNLSQLSFLFLGNNSLNGTVPAQKSSSLTNIDLSYNQLSGDFPSWINEPNLQINFVANNFTSGISGTSVLPSGLGCLQRNFPCNRDSPIYSSFGINSGGPQITSSNRIMFEWDNATLGPATYYVAPSNRWAVSNAGRHAERNTQQDTYFSSRQFTNTLDSELFQTARISGGSLRYYGLGLENGNYTVTLQFAEIEIENPETWKSLGRRVFDIYIQGTRVRQDFDIRREAGGTSYRAVSRDFTVQVSENYVEIHLFWAGKGTCCVPIQGAYGPLISAISATPNFVPTVSNNQPSSKENRTGLVVAIVIPVVVIIFVSMLALYCFLQKRKGRDNPADEEFWGDMDVRPYTFSYAELRDATNDFKPENKLGEGGFGSVYKGMLVDGRAIAVKQLSVESHQGKSQFVAEIATISAVQHRNLVKLYGCCIEAQKQLLVYEYLENKSLDQALFGNSSLYLDWHTRFEICLGIARGLAYLHEESRVRIVHRDVKASNILLDSDLNPKISDFGLAKLFDDMKTHMSTRVAGTIGYLAPEYAMRGQLTEKADVFGFGVVALEIVCGRPNSDTTLEGERIYLLEWAWNLHENKQEVEMVDEKLSKFDEDEVKRVIGIALLCTQTSPMLRPSMSRVVAMLSGDVEVSTSSSRPGYLTDWKLGDTTTTTGVSTSSSNNTVSEFYKKSSLSPTNVSSPMLQFNDSVGEGR